MYIYEEYVLSDDEETDDVKKYDDCLRTKNLTPSALIQKLSQADFSILEQTTTHSGLQEIKEIVNQPYLIDDNNATEEQIKKDKEWIDYLKFVAIHRIADNHLNGVKNWLSTSSLFGNGRNPIVNELYLKSKI